MRLCDCDDVVPWSLSGSAACVGERAGSASVGLILRRKKEHFLLLCVWVSRSVTLGSKVNFLREPRLSELQYSRQGRVRLERTLVTSG